MNFKSRLKLFFGIVFILIVCGSLALYLNYSEARVGSNGASLQYVSYDVGTEYNGIIVKQYVNLNDNVDKGEPLFELKSDVLTQQIAAGTVNPTTLSYKIDPNNGALIFTAQGSGVVTKLDYVTGSFVSAGNTIATVSTTSTATLSAKFYLSNPEYNELNPSTIAIIHFPGGKQESAAITGITQMLQNGHTLTIVKVNVSHLDTNQTVYNAQEPLSVDLVLNSNTLYERLSHNAQTYLHRL